MTDAPPPPMRPLDFQSLPEDEMRGRAERYLSTMRQRRSVRSFRSDPIPIDVVERCIEAAAQAPSGAHKQPWTYVLVTDPSLKSRIRDAAEKEEKAFYSGRASSQWLADLKPFGTDWQKPFLEDAPALIVVLAQRFGEEGPGERHYYVAESVGISVGMLLAGLTHAGFATLTHTPAPATFLRELLGRPDNERPFCIIPVGYPSEGCEVPDLERKSLDAVLIRR